MIKAIELTVWATGYNFNGSLCLYGTATNHPKRPNKPAWQMRSSRVVSGKLNEDGDLIVKTYSGSLYKLTPENVDPGYEGAFPGAFNNLVRQLRV